MKKRLKMKGPAYLATDEETRKIVERFAKDIRKELDELVKSVVWFGSAVRRDPFVVGQTLRDEVLFGSDIDVLIVLDDMMHMLSPEIVSAYRIITEKTAAKVSARLHITTMPLTRFWDYSMKGDPILINMLREGVPIYDKGCFGMAQKMLASRKIEPGREVIWIYLGRGPQSVANAKYNLRQGILDLYWAVFDAAHSALLSKGVVPDAPEFLVPLVKGHLMKQGLLHKKHVSVLSEFMNLGKLIMSGEVTKVTGDQYDRYRHEAHDFLQAVKAILKQRND